MREIIIGKNEEGQRFDKFLRKYLNKAPGSFIYKMLRKKNITLNDKKDDGATILHLNDKVNIYISEESIVNFIEENVPVIIKNKQKLEVVYEDDDIIIINKPVGMLSQKAEKNDVSANEYIIEYLLETNKLSTKDLKTFKPSVCNRLDRNTSGLLVAGKSLSGLQTMSAAFKDRSLHKYYLTVVNGVLTKQELIKGYLHKDEKTNKVTISSKEIKDSAPVETEYIPLSNNGKLTLMMINLITGKPHQIRAHLAYIGHSIIGDYKYGNAKSNDIYKKTCGISSQLLHAYKLEFEKGQTVIAPLPEKFKRLLRQENLDFKPEVE